MRFRSGLLLFATLALAAAGLSAPRSAQAADPISVPTYSPSTMPFVPPSTAELRASPRKAFAHYMPSLPVSIDNRAAAVDYYTRHYLDPEGENGDRKSVV